MKGNVGEVGWARPGFSLLQQGRFASTRLNRAPKFDIFVRDIGEAIVGAYLRYNRNCSFVLYNQRPEGGGEEGLGELDVIGISEKTVYLCEVTTHILSMDPKAAAKIESKFDRQKAFAERHFKAHKKIFELWSPVVPSGIVTRLEKLDGLDVVANAEYSARVWELVLHAEANASPTDNDAYRIFQILARLRSYPPSCACGHSLEYHTRTGCRTSIEATHSTLGARVRCTCKEPRVSPASRGP